MDQTEAEYIKKTWKVYTEELYKEDLNNPDNNDGVTTHLEPDILECEFKWALESITMNKASGGEWSHHHDYLGREDLFCIVLLCILATSSCASVRSLVFLSFIKPIFACNVPLASRIFSSVQSLSHV